MALSITFAIREKFQPLVRRGAMALTVALAIATLRFFDGNGSVEDHGIWASWLFLIGLFWLEGEVIDIAVAHVVLRWRQFPHWRRWIIYGGILLFAPVQLSLLLPLFGQNVDGFSPSLLAGVLAVGVIMFIAMSRGRGKEKSTFAKMRPTVTPNILGAPFLRRIPSSLGTNLICLRMEDHYLRIVTDKGSDLILMRFADALQELQGYPGLQVHRSWWVASKAITGTERRGRQLWIKLDNGQTAPVSRRSEIGVMAALGERI